jgi:hypothetical protein
MFFLNVRIDTRFHRVQAANKQNTEKDKDLKPRARL